MNYPQQVVLRRPGQEFWETLKKYLRCLFLQTYEEARLQHWPSSRDLVEVSIAMEGGVLAAALAVSNSQLE